MNPLKSKLRRETSNLEMVETHNLALCLHRLQETAPYEAMRKRRALYHAMLMTDGFSDEELSAIRIALKLP